MYITVSHTVRCLTDKENTDPTIIREKKAFMDRCESYHGNKLKIGNKTSIPVVETENEEENVGTFNPVTDDEDEESQIPEQEVVNHNRKPIDGLDHIVDTYINMEVRLPQGEKELYGKVIGLCLDKKG